MPTEKDKRAAVAAVKAAAAENPVENCVWSNNNAACVRTWLCLSTDVLGQTEASFDEAATVTMTELEFWNDVAAGGNVRVEAMALADILTKQFTTLIGAKYEPGHNYASAVLAMTSIMMDPAKTICELAAVVDETHRFLPEVAS